LNGNNEIGSRMKHKGQEEKRRKINEVKAKRAKQNLFFH
jgi:hypothetical protein